MIWWDPYEEISKMKKIMEKWIEGLEKAEKERDTRVPLTEISKEGKELVIKVEVPGVKKEDIEVDISDEGILTVKAERKTEKEKKKKDYYYSERSYSKFYRSLTLPEPVLPETATAKYENGVLEIRVKLAKKKEKKKKVKVK